MGMIGDIKKLSKEYLSDPKGQYFRHLQKILDLHTQSKVSKAEVLDYVEKWKKK